MSATHSCEEGQERNERSLERAVASDRLHKLYFCTQWTKTTSSHSQ